MTVLIKTTIGAALGVGIGFIFGKYYQKRKIKDVLSYYKRYQKYLRDSLDKEIEDRHNEDMTVHVTKISKALRDSVKEDNEELQELVHKLVLELSYDAHNSEEDWYTVIARKCTDILRVGASMCDLGREKLEDPEYAENLIKTIRETNDYCDLIDRYGYVPDEDDIDPDLKMEEDERAEIAEMVNELADAIEANEEAHRLAAERNAANNKNNEEETMFNKDNEGLRVPRYGTFDELTANAREDVYEITADDIDDDDYNFYEKTTVYYYIGDKIFTDDDDDPFDELDEKITVGLDARNLIEKIGYKPVIYLRNERQLTDCAVYPIKRFFSQDVTYAIRNARETRQWRIDRKSGRLSSKLDQVPRKKNRK